MFKGFEVGGWSVVPFLQKKKKKMTSRSKFNHPLLMARDLGNNRARALITTFVFKDPVFL